MEHTLRQDLWTNSIGWVLVEDGVAGRRAQIVEAGVKNLQETVDAKSGLPRSRACRTARALRRVLARRRGEASHEADCRA